MIAIDRYLFGAELNKAEVHSTGDVDRSAVKSEETKSTQVEETDDVLQILPNAHIPKVSNPKFEFVAYQTQAGGVTLSSQDSM
jgi:hypothetical protein